MSRASEDRGRILRAIRTGPVRVTDWASRHTPDHGAPILRIEARIRELQEQGWTVVRTGTHNHCPVFELTEGEDEAFEALRERQEHDAPRIDRKRAA